MWEKNNNHARNKQPSLSSKLISASIIAGDYKDLGGEIQKAENANIDLWHIDIMDGHFVPNITFGADLTRAIGDMGHKPLDVHLMVSNLEPIIDDFIALSPLQIVIHVELGDDIIAPYLKKIKEAGILAGLAIKPKTNISVLQPYLKSIDTILVMTVEPGFAGQKFIASAASKIKELDRLRKRHDAHFTIGVDGGIDPNNAQKCFDDGANILVAGSSIFKQPDYKKAVTQLKA